MKCLTLTSENISRVSWILCQIGFEPWHASLVIFGKGGCNFKDDSDNLFWTHQNVGIEESNPQCPLLSSRNVESTPSKSVKKSNKTNKELSEA